MTYYLLSHPNPNAPERGDGRYWGYAEMSAAPRAVTVHTTESLADVVGADMGAENVANYFATSSTPASYHTLIDSDSTVDCLPAGLDGTTAHTAFHCYQKNSGNLGLSFACNAAAWSTLPPAWVDSALERGAVAAAAWCVRWSIPVVKIDQQQFDNGARGISGHGLLQPEDRTDPGPTFPWDRFLALVQAKVDGFGNQLLPGGGPTGDDDVPSLLCKIGDGVFGCFGGYWLNLSGPEWAAWKDKVATVKHTDAEWATLKQWGRVK